MSFANLAHFYLPWSVALVAARVPVPDGKPALIVSLGGLDLPLVQLALALAGVLLSRPLAPRRSGERGLLRQISVTAIMLIVASAWVIEQRPGVLFTFVVSLGLGFSGYALIEAAGREVEGVGKRVLASLGAALENFGGKK